MGKRDRPDPFNTTFLANGLALMKIVFVRQGGSSRSIEAGWRVMLAAVCLVLGLAGVLSAVLYPLVTSQFMIPGVISEWRDSLADQDARVQLLEEQATAESGAVGRQLAQMQARLWRMEALGVQVADVARIPLDEFGFDLPAPQGGPAGSCDSFLESPDLREGWTPGR